MGQRRSRSRIVLVPFPAQGHVSPMLHLARLLHARGLDVTVATPDFIHRRLVAASSASGAGGGCRFASLPSGLDTEGDATPEFAAIERAMENHMPAHLERLLLQPPAAVAAEEEEEEEGALACVVVDLVASWAIPVARRCGVHVAGFWPAMLATFRIISAIPELMHRGLISEFGSPLDHRAEYNRQEQVVAEESLTLAGQAKLSTKELPWLVGNPATQQSRFIYWLRVLERAKSVQYLLVNSFPDEAGQHERSSHCHNLRPLPIGPLMLSHRTTNVSMWEADRSCLRWLQRHPPGSVVYVSFGSWVAPLSPEKIAEIAFGLEAAGRPFLWVLKEEYSWRAGLPPGFPGGRPGKIVSWAPQEEVLRSPAVGCYLTHCGWNSTLEAIQYEKRLLCHPVAGDQFVNAAFIVKVWGIGAMLDGAERSAVEDGIRRAMASDEGEQMQASVERLRRRVMGDGEGNSRAMENLQCFLDRMKQNMQ